MRQYGTLTTAAGFDLRPSRGHGATVRRHAGPSRAAGGSHEAYPLTPARAAACALGFILCLGAAQGRTFTLREAVAFALKHSSQTAIARAQEARARAQLKLTNSAWQPAIGVSYGYLFSNNPLEALSAELERRQVTATAFAPSALNYPGVTRLGTTTLSLAWPIYMGGARHDATRAGRYGRQAAQAAAARNRQTVMAGVIQAYEGVIMAREAVAVARRAVAAAAGHARTAASLYAQGRIVHSDALTADVNLGADQGLLAQARGDVRIATDNLVLAMGAGPGVTVVIPHLAFTRGTLPRRPLSYYVQQALDHRPDVKALQGEIKAAYARARAARDRSSVQVRLMAQTQWFSETPGIRHNAWTVGAVISKSLYDGGRNRDHAAVLLAQAATLAGRLAGLRAHIRYQVTQAYEDMQNALTRYDIARATVGRARRAVALTRVRYGEGRTILLDLLNSEQGLVQAREARLAALYALAANRAALAAACGQLSLTRLPALRPAS